MLTVARVRHGWTAPLAPRSPPTPALDARTVRGVALMRSSSAAAPARYEALVSAGVRRLIVGRQRGVS